MLRDGPIPRFVHGILEYALGVLFIAAPFIFDFDSGAATGMSVAVGVLILILAAVTEGPVSLVNQLPVLLHVALLYLLAIFMVAAPFLLGFSDEPPPRNLFMISGVLLLLITIGTRFRRSEPESIDRNEPTRRAAPPTQSARSDDGPPPAAHEPSMPPPGSSPAAPGMLPPVPPQSSPGVRPRSQQTWTGPDSGGPPQP